MNKPKYDTVDMRLYCYLQNISKLELARRCGLSPATITKHGKRADGIMQVEQYQKNGKCRLWRQIGVCPDCEKPVYDQVIAKPEMAGYKQKDAA